MADISSIVFPVFVFEESADLIFCQSVERLETELEGVDVEDGVFEAYDAGGRAVILEAVGVKRGWISVEVGKVNVVGVSEIPSSKRFTEKMQSYLSKRGGFDLVVHAVNKVMH